ncbi:MAG: endonuclease/exonuclease/phosphatase family protein [Pseudomonadota bacterium]
MAINACAVVPPSELVRGRFHPAGETASGADPHFSGPLTVLTLNVAHGRGTAFSQVFQRGTTTRDNLMNIAAFLKKKDVDIVALQEADGPSLWSGSIDHVALMADNAGFSWHARAAHVSGWMATYGTALLSRRPFVQAAGHTFQPSPPTLNKGFLLGCFDWQPDPEAGGVIKIDVISVHLDFSRTSVRAEQIAEMAQYLAGRDNPTIILGDFNSDWLAGDSVVKALSNQAGLEVYRPAAADLGTYGDGRHRLDWILISSELTFIRYAVMPERLSDHLAVVATIGMRKAGVR